MTNQNPLMSLELEQMETYAQFLQTLDSAVLAMNKLSDSAPYLNFNKHSMIQKYYDSLSGICSGLNMLKEGFYEYAGSHNIDLKENFQD